MAKLCITYHDRLTGRHHHEYECYTFHYDALIEIIEGYLKGRVNKVRK